MIQQPNIPIKSRIAPTPSGFLHLGNAVNFLLIYLLVDLNKGNLLLRIDDIDMERVREDYVSDIFDQLKWLGISWNCGPQHIKEFPDYSQHKRLQQYSRALETLWQAGQLFVCNCSRKQLQHSDAHSCPHHITNYNKTDGLRLKSPYPIQSWYDYYLEEVINLHKSDQLFEPIIWRKHVALPSYQLACVVDDIEDDINLIIRGYDLLRATECQFFLAEKLEYSEYKYIKFLHHHLITDEYGNKLSKSAGSTSLKQYRLNNSISDFYRYFARWAKLPNAAEINDLSELKHVFQLHYSDFRFT